MKVRLYDHRRIFEARRGEIMAAVEAVLASGRPDWGEEVPAFEREFAAWLGVPHVVTTNSGTAALKLALLAIGIGHGDEVITVPNTDSCTISSIHLVGGRAVFVDVDPVTMTMDPAAAEAAITPRTKAILPVDLYGHPAALPAIVDLARRRGLRVVEDACLAPGATIGGRNVGQWSDVTCFSFSPNKHLGAMGSAGGCATADPDLARAMEMISGCGNPRSAHSALIGGAGTGLRHEFEGMNERMDEVQAAILRVKLRDLDASLAARRRQADLYARGLSDVVTTPAVAPGATHAWRNYVIRTEDRDARRARLTALGIGSSLSYSPPMHLQPIYAGLGHGEGAFPVAEAAGRTLMSLPIGPHLTDADVETVIAAVREAVAARPPG